MPDAFELIHSPHLHRQSPQFAGAQGPLSRDQGRVILARLERRMGEGENGILENHLAFEQAITGEPLIVGNKVTLLENGPDTYHAMFEAIESAEDNINLETYTFEDDSVGEKFADALIAKQHAGVQVNVIFDDLGSIHTSASFFDRLRSAGIRALRFNPLNPTKRRFHFGSANHRDHRKLMIVDGTIAFMGGVNISEVYSHDPREDELVPGEPDSWRDTDIELEGPAVAECQRLFLDTWDRQDGLPLSQRNYFPPLQNRGNEVVRVIGSVPQQSSLIYVTLISAINNAESNVYITDAYFAPDSQMLKQLEATARRGVDVRLLVPGEIDEPLIKPAARSHYSALLDAGVKIYEWRGKMLHAKTATIDHVWSTVGSSNLDWWSIARNNEVNVAILSSRFGREMDLMFDRDLKNSTPIDRGQWESRPIIDRIEETLANILEPLL